MFEVKERRHGLALLIVGLIYLGIICYGLYNGNFQQGVKALTEKSFPFEMILLEGAPGLAGPAAEQTAAWREQALRMSLYLLTGVHLSDARTYFLGYYALPEEGPAWIGWMYYPEDPEREGLIPELVNEPWQAEPVLPESPQAEGDILVGIYHTHSAESYSGEEGLDREKGGEKGEIVEVGRILADRLNDLGVPAVQATEVNDAVYAEAYDKSQKAAQELLQEYPTICLLLDVHRDGLPETVGKNMSVIQGVDTARIMIVVGQKNPHWEENNALAEKLIRLGEEKYPGLFLNKIRYAGKARYNQHLLNGALLLEIGSQLNTEGEAQAAAAYLAEVLKESLKE